MSTMNVLTVALLHVSRKLTVLTVDFHVLMDATVQMVIQFLVQSFVRSYGISESYDGICISESKNNAWNVLTNQNL